MEELVELVERTEGLGSAVVSYNPQRMGGLQPYKVTGFGPGDFGTQVGHTYAATLSGAIQIFRELYLEPAEPRYRVKVRH